MYYVCVLMCAIPYISGYVGVYGWVYVVVAALLSQVFYLTVDGHSHSTVAAHSSSEKCGPIEHDQRPHD